MVDADRTRDRLGRLEHLIERLDRVRRDGEEAYLVDEDRRAMTERRLQLAVQIAIDIAAAVASEQAVPPARDYAGVFVVLGRGGLLDGDLAERLAAAARQRNLLVHDYLELDDRLVFASLEHLDDLRAFAARVAELVDA